MATYRERLAESLAAYMADPETVAAHEAYVRAERAARSLPHEEYVLAESRADQALSEATRGARERHAMR